MTLNRTKAPETQNIKSIEFVKPHVFDINEAVKLYWMREVPNETARLDLYFNAGSIRGKIGIASFVNGLLLSGTSDKTSTEINHQLDLLGGFHESGITNEGAVFSLYGLRENFPALIRVLKDAIAGLAFHEDEVIELIASRKQKYLVNLKKTSYLAQRGFQEKLFASSEFYSRTIDESTYEDVTPQELKRFFQKYYLNGLTKVTLVGNFHPDFTDEVIDTFGTWAIDQSPKFEESASNETGEFHIEKEDALQTTLRVGRIMFNKNHPDFIDFQILNTLLGDYFGSRLMTNLREDKGYTYGIGAMTSEFHNFGYFLIATEVGKENRQNALNEIKKEIDRLQNELVPIEELDLVRNYLLGQLLKSADGPYSMLDLYLNVEEQNCDLTFYNEFIERIQEIEPKRIQELAKTYLNWKDFSIVSAG
ncbi:MAG: insulinase family protein [Bacteroidetes bacterium]|nr:insulinase family protein [Bacteroidota bacterium]